MYSTILAERQGTVGVVTLNRPERMNVLTPTMGRELRHAIATFDMEEDIRAIVVAGTGRSFCAGADISDEPRDADNKAGLELEPPSDLKYWEMNTPIIAAMNGSAAGGGLTIPIQWDFRFMADDARYTFVFNRRGLLPELGSTWILPRLVGLSRASELLLTGRVFTGAEAVAMGLATASAPATDIVGRSLDFARDIAENAAPVSVALTKRLLWTSFSEPDHSAREDLELELFKWTLAQTDASEGIRAFLEKRAPTWSMAKNADFPTDLYDHTSGEVHGRAHGV